MRETWAPKVYLLGMWRPYNLRKKKYRIDSGSGILTRKIYFRVCE